MKISEKCKIYLTPRFELDKPGYIFSHIFQFKNPQRYLRIKKDIKLYTLMKKEKIYLNQRSNFVFIPPGIQTIDKIESISPYEVYEEQIVFDISRSKSIIYRNNQWIEINA